jgi:hypothetical protein
MGRVHRVFTSYHQARDEEDRRRFEGRFGRDDAIFVPRGVSLVEDGAAVEPLGLRRFMRERCLLDTAVTVVLIGPQTWQLKRVDWEISSSLHATEGAPRSGLLGLFLPSHPAFGRETYDARTIPPRLHDNVECAYAVLSDWTDDPRELQELIHVAYLNSRDLEPEDRRALLVGDLVGPRWAD